jgi:hypothetical protein
MNWKLWQPIVMLACPAIIVWLGSDAIDRINELYDGLCPTLQGPGMARLLPEGDPQGYCTGIGDYLYTLQIIMFVAALAVPAALAGFWYYKDHSASKRWSNRLD